MSIDHNLSLNFLQMSPLNGIFSKKQSIHVEEFLFDSSEEFMSEISTTGVSEGDCSPNTLRQIVCDILHEKRVGPRVNVSSIRKAAGSSANLKNKRWTASEELAFWNLLKEFGTNFDFIAERL